MKALIVIPARYESSRFPGKPLAELTGANGVARSLIRRSWDAARAVDGDHEIYVATDDDRIKVAAEAFGAQVVMTSPEARNGTERVAEAALALGSQADVIVNLQGDAPLTPPWFVEALIAAFEDPALQVATPVLRCSPAALNGFLDDRAAGRVGGTTAVFDSRQNALYFSKEVIPYTHRRYEPGEDTPVFHHVGVYAFRPGALKAYNGWQPGPLEGLEGLEQLRFLENGTPVRCVEVEARGTEFWEVNNPVDVPRVEAILQDRGID